MMSRKKTVKTAKIKLTPTENKNTKTSGMKIKKTVK